MTNTMLSTRNHMKAMTHVPHTNPQSRKTGGSMTSYTATRRDTGALITRQPTRFLAVARAAAVLHNPEPQRSPA